MAAERVGGGVVGVGAESPLEEDPAFREPFDDGAVQPDLTPPAKVSALEPEELLGLRKPIGRQVFSQTPRAVLAPSLRKLASGLQGADTKDLLETESGTALPAPKSGSMAAAIQGGFTSASSLPFSVLMTRAGMSKYGLGGESGVTQT